jgi:D-glycero-alpha-D-manno-heptose-7-phosphate kinase
MIAARSPLRISFGGGGTDLPAYYERFGGMVVSAAITPACHVSLTPTAGRGVMLQSRDFGVSVTVPSRPPMVLREPLSLPRAVLSWFGERDLFPHGVSITTRADVPPGSGLGSSSAMTVALVSAIASHVCLPLTPRMAAEIACQIEIDLLGRPIGRQDQYASALGGINTIAFSRGAVVVTPMALPPAARQALQDHLLLVSTRRTRDSANVLRGQRAASGGDGEVTRRLHRIKELAAAMATALLGSDLPAFGALLDESWQLKRGLAQGVSSTEIDRWYQIARDRGAYGGKIAGAGGGGFFLFCVPPDRRADVTRGLCAAGLAPLPFAFDDQGCTVRDEPDLTAARSRTRFAVKGPDHETANAR